MAERRFTEKQTAEILRLAVQGQSESGLTSESELRAAAQEMGISPEAIERAIAKTESAPPGTSYSRMWGGPMGIAFDESFEGELTNDVWEETIADARKTFGDEGTISERENVREWTCTGGGLVPIQLTLRQQKGTVRLNASSRLDGLATMTGVLALPVLLIGMALIGKFGGRTPLGMPLFMMLFVALVLFVARHLFSRYSHGHAESMNLVTRRLRSRLAETSTEPTLPVDQAEEEHLTA
jgi:hypothetical protein